VAILKEEKVLVGVDDDLMILEMKTLDLVKMLGHFRRVSTAAIGLSADGSLIAMDECVKQRQCEVNVYDTANFHRIFDTGWDGRELTFCGTRHLISSSPFFMSEVDGSASEPTTGVKVVAVPSGKAIGSWSTSSFLLDIR